MNIVLPSLQSSPCGRTVPSSAKTNGSNATAMSNSDLVDIFGPRKFDQDDISSMDSTPFCSVSLYDNYNIQRFCEVKNITFFMRTLNRKFDYWQQREEGRNVQPRQSNIYHQQHQNGCQNYNRSPSVNQNETRQLAPAKNDNSNCQAVQSVTFPSNQNLSKNYTVEAKRGRPRSKLPPSQAVENENLQGSTERSTAHQRKVAAKNCI